MSTDALAGAAATLEEIVAKDPSTALYLPVAERMLARGLAADAIRLCEERRARPGKGVGDHIVLGRCYLADGRLAEASAEFRHALSLDRENVVALKALAGILSHEGRHSEAADLYRAVCRVDGGDLESQSALHQITSGEYPEVRPPEIIVSQGDLSWQPVRVSREEDHLSELALGLPTFDTLDAGVLRPAPPLAEIVPPPLAEESIAEVLERAPVVERGPIQERTAIVERGPVPAPGPDAGSNEFHDRLGSLDVADFQTSALERLDEVFRPSAVRELGEVTGATESAEPVSAEPVSAEPVSAAPESAAPTAPEATRHAPELPASALVEDGETPAAVREGVGRSAVWRDEPAPAPESLGAKTARSQPAPAEAPSVEPASPSDAPGVPALPTVQGNRAAFETWLRRLGERS